MKILLDTNILLRLANPPDPHHAVAEQAVSELQADGHTLCLVPQNLYEYWVVAPRPGDQNGLGMPATVDAAIENWLELFRLYRDERSILDGWRSLVVTHDVKGRPAHDARLIAALQRHRLDELLTFNTADFQRYGINVTSPHDVIE